MMQLTAEREAWPLREEFIIARGGRTVAEVVVATFRHEGTSGRGEATPYPRFGETVEGVLGALREAEVRLGAGMPPDAVMATMTGAARNALDCALWDWRAKRAEARVHDLLEWPTPGPVATAFTLSVAKPEAMEAAARRNAWRPLLKIKTGTECDAVESLQAVRRGAPESQLIVDANESWPQEKLLPWLEALAALGVLFVEQPLPAGEDEALAKIARPIPVFADEAFHRAEDVAACRGKYDGVNIKLDKAGGLTPALEALAAARGAGMRVMCGCMLSTSLAIAPAFLLAQRADVADLDGPLLLAHDRPEGLVFDAGRLLPYGPALWG